MWYRVFGTSEVNPEPAALLEHLHQLGLDTTAQFGGDAQGWFRARFTLNDPPATVLLERYLATEEGIRHELNTWAAWLETLEEDPNQGQLLRHVAGATQLFTLEQNPDLDRPGGEPP